MSDLISRQAAIDALTEENLFKHMDTVNDGGQENRSAIRIIKSLPSAQLKNDDCDYCHEDSDGYVKPIEKNCHAAIHFGMNGWCLELRAKGWHGETKINYCPMCGRKLRNG